MSDGGLRLHLAGADRPRPGFLRVGPRHDADVPFRHGDELPFEDGAADIIVLDANGDGMHPDGLLQTLLECRRVLRAQGELHVTLAGYAAAAIPSTGLARVDDLAALIGLEPHSAAGPGTGRLKAPGAAMATRLLTKRERTLNSDPLVSIAIPAYSPRFFAASLDSALAQTYEPLEIIVCDDSPDDAIAAITAARSARRTIRYERNRTRLRPRANFVRCFERARGEFVKLLCDDDVLEPTCVEKLLEAFRRAPDVTLATSHRLRIDDRGEVLPPLPATTRIVTNDSLIAGYTLVNAMLMAGLNTIGEPSTTLFRRSEFLDHAPEYFHFRGEAGHGIIDMVMWCALLLKGNAVYLAESLSSFRSHPGQRQNDPGKMQRNMASIRGLQAAWLRLGLHELLPSDAVMARPFPPSSLDDWHWQGLLGFAARRAAPA